MPESVEPVRAIVAPSLPERGKEAFASEEKSRSWYAQPLRAALAAAPLLLAAAWALLRSPAPALCVLVLGAAAQLGLLLLSAVRVAAPWERAVVIRGGRPVAVRGPGLFVFIPLLEEQLLVDLRLRALALQRRRLRTLDRKPVWIEAALFYQIADPLRALLTCRNLDESLARLGQGCLHRVVSRVLLSTLEKRAEQVENELEAEAARRAQEWGVRFDLFRLLAVDPVYLHSTQPEVTVDEQTAERLANAEFPPGIIHGVDALKRDRADEVVHFPAAVGRRLKRSDDTLPD